MPDTFHLIAEYAKGHSLVLSSCDGEQSQHIPGLIRGHEGTVEDGGATGSSSAWCRYITVTPEVKYDVAKKADGHRSRPLLGSSYKFGTKPIEIAVDQKDMMMEHIGNFLHCMRTREKPHLDVETGARAVVVINLAGQSYREGKTMYWDEKHWKAVDKPVKA